MVVALRLWKSLLSERPAIVFVDNEATKSILVSAYSSKEVLAALCDLACTEELAQGSTIYFERVASAANPSDAPSRAAAPLPLRNWPHPQRVLVEELVVLGHEGFDAVQAGRATFRRGFASGSFMPNGQPQAGDAAMDSAAAGTRESEQPKFLTDGGRQWARHLWRGLSDAPL